MLLKDKELCDKFVTLNKKIEYDKLTYYFKSEDGIPICFNGFNRPLGLIRNIKDGSIDLEKAKENQEKFRSNISETTRGKWENKLEEQKNTINNLKMFYKVREKVIKFFDEYTTIVFKAKYEAKHGKGLNS